MRVTQKTMYEGMSRRMNSVLSDYMESGIQSASMKRVNRPSDDPAGTARILHYRASISQIQEYMKCSQNAQGWLQMADSTLGSEGVTASLISIKALAEQAATATYNADQRMSIGAQLREKLGELINLSNTEYEGKHLFAGQEYNGSPFLEGLTVTCLTSTGEKAGLTEENPLNPPMQVTGSLAKTAAVRFLPIAGTNPAQAGTVPPLDGQTTTYEWSLDGGKTWTQETIPSGERSFTVGGATVTVPAREDGKPNIYQPQPYLNDSEIGIKIADADGSLPTGVVVLTEGVTKDTKIGFPNGLDLGSLKDGNNISYTYQELQNGEWKTITTTAQVKVDLVDPTKEFPTALDKLNNKDNPPDGVKYKVGIELKLPTGTVTVQTEYTSSAKWDSAANDGKGKYVEDFPAIELSDDLKITVSGEAKGSLLHVRPTAIYQGSDNNAQAKVSQYGTATIPSTVTTFVTNSIQNNVLVKFPDGVDLSTAGEFTYQYSSDGGKNWTTGTSSVKLPNPPTNPQTSSARLMLPGGYMDIGVADITQEHVIPPNGQFSIRPQRSDLSFEVMKGQYLQVNNVGKDIFGGLYKPGYGDNLEAMYGGEGKNVFETLGRLIGYCETNNVTGIGECVADLKEALAHIESEVASIGGKENRVATTIQVLTVNQDDQATRMSNIEDIDITALMMNLSRQETAYSAVLKSSSMIMQLNLMQFL